MRCRLTANRSTRLKGECIIVRNRLLKQTLFAAGLAAAFALSPVRAQSGDADGKEKKAVQRNYLPAPFFNPGAQYRTALGPRFDAKGGERVVMRGTLKWAAGTFPVTVTRELDEGFRIDFGGSSPRSLIAGALNSKPAFAAAPSQPDADLLETLYDDTPESLFYSLQFQGGFRLLGQGFRTPNEKGRTDKSVYCDIFERAVPVAVAPNQPRRYKHYYFDSRTKLFFKTRYKLERGGSKKVVEVIYSDWRKSGDRMIPGKIVRQENGEAVITLVVQELESAATAADNMFVVTGK